MNRNDTHQYDDIIRLPHHVSTRHPQMSAAQRAMQFASYKALAGYEDRIEETRRLTDPRRDLDEDQKEELDRILHLLTAQTAPSADAARNPGTEDGIPGSDSAGRMAKTPLSSLITVTWFCPDEYKEGGASRTVRGQFRKADPLRRTLTLLPESEGTDASCASDPLQIPIDDIYRIELNW